MNEARYFLSISGDFKGETFVMLNACRERCVDGTKKLVCINDGLYLSDTSIFGGRDNDFVEITKKQLAALLLY